MDELFNLVVQKTGLPPEVAKIAVQTVLDYMKQKRPPSVAGQIDALAGVSGDSSGPADVAKNVLGGILGKK